MPPSGGTRISLLWPRAQDAQPSRICRRPSRLAGRLGTVPRNRRLALRRSKVLLAQ